MITSPPVEKMEVAVRAWATPDYQRHIGGPGGGHSKKAIVDLGPSEWSVTFDTETTTDASQRLRIGTYQVRYRNHLWEAGFFYDEEALTTGEVETLQSFVVERDYRLCILAEFVEEVLLYYVYDLRGLLIGFNLPFDISRIALRHVKSRSKIRRLRGAFSFTMSNNPTRPCIQVKRASVRAAFIRFAEPEGRSPERRNQEAGGDVSVHDGYIVDVAVLASALLTRSFSLAGLANMLETEHRKLVLDDYAGALTPGMLDYAIRDVQVTWECFEKLRDRYDRYGLTATPVYRVFSEASIGKAHLKQMGLRPLRKLQPDFPAWLIAATLESYYGGRAETRIRRTPVPGVLVDFVSQYPTAYVLQDLWRFQIAQSLHWEDEDPTKVQALLDGVTVDDVIHPALWLQLQCLVLIEPDGDLLPTRARYTQRNGRTGQRRSVPWNVGVSRRVGGPAQWWTLAAAIGSVLGTGKAPKVLRCIRFYPGPPQQGLEALDIAGNPRYRVDPSLEDAIRRLVELRAETKQDRKVAETAGDSSRAAWLDSVQLGLKIAANAIAYGMGIEINVHEHSKPVKVTVHRPDGTNYRTKSRRAEEPGQWFHPVIATLVAAGGQLLLTAAMRLVHDAGSEYVFCDTDSLFIAATKNGSLIACEGSPEGTVTALSWAQVDEIVGRFTSLNPYNPEVIPGSILEIETENFDPQTGLRWEIECFSIAAKRYALYRRRSDGTPELVGSGEKRKRSEHGLGHLISPVDKNSEENWFDLWWEHLLHLELGIDHPEPEWFDQAAVGQLTIGSFHELASFGTFNQKLPYWKQVRPFGFLTIAHPAAIEVGIEGGPRCLVAPYETNPTMRMRRRWWFDRHQPGEGAYRIRTGDPEEHIDQVVAVKSYRDYFEAYRLHREAKGAAADGQPCHTWTRGLLQPRTIRSAQPFIRIGKEANRLSESPDLVIDDHDQAIQYNEPRHCQACGKPLTGRQRRWCSDGCRKRWEREVS
jgi:hypothetical protein